MEQNTITHISQFIKTNEITDNIMCLFTNNLKMNHKENINNDKLHNINEKNDSISMYFFT